MVPAMPDAPSASPLSVARAGLGSPLLRDVALSPRLRAPRMAALRGFRATYGSRRPVLPFREDLPRLLNRRGLVGCGVEVGVKRGEFSEALLAAWGGAHLVSVDPWLEAGGDEYVDVANVAQDQHEQFYTETRGRLQKFGSRSTIWRMTGDEAAKRILHHSLDFVYLDARHDYPSVLSDLADWFDRVRPGGLIAGHDYVDGDLPEGDFGVRSAVDEYFAGRRLTVHATFADPPWISWFVALPAATPA